MIADDRGRIVDANARAADLFASSKEELVGQSIAELVPEDCDFEEAWREIRASEQQRGTFPLVSVDGSVRTVEYTAVTDIDQGLNLAICREVTEQTSQARA